MTPIPRLHLFEFHEKAWCPAFLRNGLRAMLQRIASTFPGYEAIVDELQAAVQATGATEVVDLCTGGGGPWVRIAERLPADSPILRVRLTDLFPDVGAMEAMQRDTGGLAVPHERPVDALEEHPELPGFRTVFAAFHHFSPQPARQVLARAVATGEGVGVFELTERQPWALMVPLSAFPLAMGLIPFVRPFRWVYLPFTYLVPALPIMLAFDGLVSCLRTYEPEELLAMGREVAPHYEWRAGRVRPPQGRLNVVYLVGIPPRREPA